MLETKNWFSIKNLIAVGLGIAALYLLTSFLVDTRFKEIELNTRVQISNQETLLVTIAETTARNGADAVTESIVKDCPVDERIKFDDSLGRLDKGLTQSELVELERLFGRCGAFSSERKSVMVSRLAREIEIYQSYVEQLAVITKEDQAINFSVPAWQALSVEESKQSKLFTRLVALQDEIITALLAGSRSTSPEIADILHEVREVQETLVVANKQAAVIREGLVSL